MAMVRVEDIDTGHKYSIEERAVDPAAHKVLKDDAVDAGGLVIPPEHKQATTTAAKKGDDK